MVPLPTASPVARPFASIETAGPDEDQVTDPVTFCVEPSLYVAVAVN